MPKRDDLGKDRSWQVAAVGFRSLLVVEQSSFEGRSICGDSFFNVSSAPCVCLPIPAKPRYVNCISHYLIGHTTCIESQQ